MAHFVMDTNGDYINLDCVATITSEGSRYTCFARDGERLGAVDDFPLGSRVIADTTGTILIAFWDGDPGETYTCRYPILGWRIEGGERTVPIICEDLPDVWCLELSERIGEPQRFIFPDDSTTADFEQAKARAAETLRTNLEIRRRVAEKRAAAAQKASA